MHIYIYIYMLYICLNIHINDSIRTNLLRTDNENLLRTFRFIVSP